MQLFSDGFWTGFGLGMCGGGAIIWLFKDTVQKWVLGAEGFVSSLQTKINAVKAATTTPPATPPKA
jgi:hypothetical protein